MPPVKMMGSSLISVVIPAYNRATTITDCLRSVQAQTYQNWEVVAVDDGSHDGTPEIIERLAHDDARIRLIRHDRNRGAQAARNSGIYVAKGEWVTFLDSDDQYLPHSLEKRITLANTENVHVVHSECQVIEPGGAMKTYHVPAIKGHAYTTLLTHEGPVYPALMITREALQRINYLDEGIKAFQEWDLSIRLAKHYRFAFEPTPTFIYDCRHADAMSKDLLRAGRGYEQVFRKHLFAILRHVGSRGLVYHYEVAERWYQGGKDQRAARRCARLSRLWSICDLRSIPKRLYRRLKMSP